MAQDHTATLSEASLIGSLEHILASIRGDNRQLLIDEGFAWDALEDAMERIEEADIGYTSHHHPINVDLSDAAAAEPIIEELREHLATLREIGPALFQDVDQIYCRILCTVPDATAYMCSLSSVDYEHVYMLTLQDDPDYARNDAGYHVPFMDNVRAMVLFGNYLESDHLDEFGFSGKKELEYLDLSDNICTTLPQDIEACAGLEYLSLSGCSEVSDLDADLSTLTALRMLDLRATQVEQDTIAELEEALPECTTLS